MGVFDPQLDFQHLASPDRLEPRRSKGELGAEERVGVMPEEVSGVYFRSSRPLPKDDDFVSSFRRPLREEHQLRHL